MCNVLLEINKWKNKINNMMLQENVKRQNEGKKRRGRSFKISLLNFLPRQKERKNAAEFFYPQNSFQLRLSLTL